MSTEAEKNNDDKAWELLNNNRLKWNGYDEQEETVWPCNRSEIRVTRSVLNSIDFNQLKHEQVIEEYENQRTLCDDIEKELPNNRLKMILPLALMLIAIVFYFWYTHSSKENHFDSEDWIVNIDTEMLSSSELDPHLERTRDTIEKGTIVTPMGMGEQRYVKVKLSTGEKGFIHVAAFSGVPRNSTIEEGTALYSLSNPDKEIGKIEKDLPQIISIAQIDDDNNRLIKVKTTKGNVGYIYDNHIKYHFTDSILDLELDRVLPVASTKASKWKGQQLEAVEGRYGISDAFIDQQAYWNNIRIIGDTLAYQGLIANVNHDGVIDTVLFGQQEKLLASMSSFPLWRILASIEPFYKFIDWNYEQDDRILNVQWWENIRSKHWSLKILVWVIELVLKLMIFILKLSIFFLPIMTIGIIISHLERVSTNSSRLITLTLTILVLVSLGIFTILQGQFQIIAMIILFVVATAHYLAFTIHLSNKCPNCGNWHGEITEKTDFLGHSVSVQYGSRDKYVGSDTRLASVSDSINQNKKTYTYETTNKYKKLKTKDTYEYDNYKDHQMCKYCGLRWTVRYKILRGQRHHEE